MSKKFEDLVKSPGRVASLPTHNEDNSLQCYLTDQKFLDEWREQSKLTAEEERAEEQADRDAMMKIPALGMQEYEEAEDRSLSSQLKIGKR